MLLNHDEWRCQLGGSEQRARIYHYSDQQGAAVVTDMKILCPTTIPRLRSRARGHAELYTGRASKRTSNRTCDGASRLTRSTLALTSH